MVATKKNISRIHHLPPTVFNPNVSFLQPVSRCIKPVQRIHDFAGQTLFFKAFERSYQRVNSYFTIF